MRRLFEILNIPLSIQRTILDKVSTGRRLRKLLQLDPAEYMLAISGNDALRELSSCGKSRSFFYLTQHDRFMIKMAKKSEVKQSLAPASLTLDESVGKPKPKGVSANNSISNNENIFERDEYPVIVNGVMLRECKENEIQNSSKEAVDFMGASLRSNGQHTREESVAKYEAWIELDLSQTRSNASENQSF
ncbi:unnamed protein product [Arabis nemorensis]|uniref:1-phosphatidylinositol-4-phosphate 5-kinase n=1 Tax=Arabis nemorensis TaxID=586526 RepID=A0A565AYN8_9BRAS|nr:unnamed protein product [Arabis nemorensis]